MKITDWFKEIVKNKKELNLRIGAGVLATIMVAAGLSGCSNKKEEQEKEKTSVSDTMNDDELCFDDKIRTHLFRPTYDFNTEVTRRDNQQEIRDYLEKNEPYCCLWVDGPGTRNYEIVINTSGENGIFYQIFSIENKLEEGKYEFYTSINDRYTLLKRGTKFDCVLDHETGRIVEISHRNLRKINSSYMIGNLEDHMGQTYKLYYANGEEALYEDYENAVWDLYNDDAKDTNILFLISGSYTDMVNLDTREIKRLNGFVVTNTYSNYIVGHTEDKDTYVFAYDGFDLKQISKIGYEKSKGERLVPTEKNYPNLIMWNYQGTCNISDIYGNRLSAVYNEINGIPSYGNSVKEYYTGENDLGKNILTSEGEHVLSLNPEEDFCFGVFNDDIFLIRNTKTNKEQAIKVIDGQIVGAIPESDAIEFLDDKGLFLFLYDAEKRCTYAYDKDLNYIETIAQEDTDKRYDVISQIREDAENEKVNIKK